MNILMAASEMAPFARTGALADAVAELSSGLRALGHDVSVVIPYYRSLREDKTLKRKKSSLKFSVQVGSAKIPAEIHEAKTADGIRLYLVARDEYFDRTGVYGVDGRDYQDNAARFIYFTKCALELARRITPVPDIFHAHSWEAALAPVFARDQQLPFHTVLTPHSLEYQGNFWSYDFGLTNLPGDYFSPKGLEYFGSLNCLKAGLLYADAVVLPSERFAAECQTSAYGCGLEPVLREQQHKLVGIPGDFGLTDWNPENDPQITAFSAGKPAPRDKNRLSLLTALGFSATPPKATFVTFTEASQGKGLDILLASLDRLLANDVRLALLGPVSPKDTAALEVARRKHGARFAQITDYSEKLARLALAGGDFLLVPESTEPETTWLRRALRYGTIPIAAQCTGLFQFVRDWDPASDTGNGFVFSFRTVDGLVDIAQRALKASSDGALQAKLRLRCLQTDFSSEGTSQGHIALYNRLLGREGKSLAA